MWTLRTRQTKKSRQINGLVNEWYLEDLSNNVRSVLSHKRREGKFIGSSALYGYQKDPADKNHLVIDPEAAEVVKRIFALYLAGNGTTRIARILNEECVPSPTQYKREHGVVWKRPARYKNEDLWGKATIYRMLTNRSYAGDMEQGRHKKVSYKSKKTVWIPKKDWIVVPGTHEGIIERDSFERVQQMLRAHARGGGRGTVNPLAGKVVCGICGCTMEQTASGYAGKKNRKGEPLLSLPHFTAGQNTLSGAELYADGAAAGAGTGADAPPYRWASEAGMV